jgi:hypothetical protein
MSKIAVVIVVTLVFLSILFPFHQAISDTTTTISVEPQGSFGLLPGDTFSINITVSNVIDLYAWQFQLYYDSSVLNATTRLNNDITPPSWEPDIDEGPFLKTGGVSTFWGINSFTDNYNSTHGYIELFCSRLPPLNGTVPGVSGTGTLATIRFKTLSYGLSILHLDNTKLLDSADPFGNYIPHTRIDGQAYIGLVDVAIDKIDTSINIPKGSVALINVTAQNRGQTPETFDVTLSYNGNPIDGTKTVVNLPGGGSEILNFTWDTTPIPFGQYNLTATATTVPGETDFADNTLSIMVQVGVRDLAIFDITPRTIVGQGYTVNFNVTVQNNGQTTETSNVTLYVDSNGIGNATDPLAGGAQETIRFTWNTTQVVWGNHNMTAYVWPVPFEASTTNNNYTQTVHVGVPGDVSSTTPGAYDGVVNMKDIAYMVILFNTKPSSLNWNPNADVNDDGVCNMKDIAIAILNFNKHE